MSSFLLLLSLSCMNIMKFRVAFHYFRVFCQHLLKVCSKAIDMWFLRRIKLCTTSLFFQCTVRVSACGCADFGIMTAFV